MAKMGRYCRAYSIKKLREFSGWAENVQNLRKEKKQEDGKEIQSTKESDDSGYYYLQENFVVTDGIFIDENIIFDEVTPGWIDFCKNRLQFQVPLYGLVKGTASEKADGKG